MNLKTKQRVLVALCVISIAIDVISKSNLNVAIVAMVWPAGSSKNQVLLQVEQYINNCVQTLDFGSAVDPDQFITPGPKYDWSPSFQGILLGMINLGLGITHIPAGRVAEKYGGKWVLAVGIGMAALANFVTPFVAKYNVLMVASRIFLGFGVGVIYPACYALFVEWLPRDDALSILPFLTVGGNVGHVLANISAGYFSASDFLQGWPATFFFSGKFFANVRGSSSEPLLLFHCASREFRFHCEPTETR